MTSRRQFFGVLAAAPLVAPAVVKEMVAATPPNALRASVGLKPLPWADGKAFIGCRIVEGPFLVGEGESIHITGRFIPRQRHYVEIDAARDFDFLLGAPPNRLYGSQINADGDAV